MFDTGRENKSLNTTEREFLLRLAREAIECAAARKKLPPLDRSALSPALLADGATFITLTKNNQLRGCIGGLQARRPLAEDVREHALAAATQDPRFNPVRADEVPALRIEVSRLTNPKPLEYSSAEDLVSKLRPHIDGVVLEDGVHRATFLPQVWEKIPDAADFLDNLCAKMGLPRKAWRTRPMRVSTYQVEEFREPD